MSGYFALVHEERARYRVSFPDLPGCASDGETFEEAVAKAAEALAAHLTALKADGDPIPAPRTYDELKHDRKFVKDAAGAVVTIVTPLPTPAEASVT